MTKAVLFDRDGVILNTPHANVTSTIKTFEEMGIDLTNEDKKKIVGRHTRDFVKLIKPKYDFSYEEFRKKQKVLYYELFEKVEIFERTVNLIKKLHGKVTLALTTSSSRQSTLKVLKRAGIVFDLLVTSEDYEKSKPDPEPYLVTAKKLGVKPEDCVVIEDSIVGLESAKRAGMKCIVIPNEYTKHQDFSEADFIVNSADEITDEMLGL